MSLVKAILTQLRDNMNNQMPIQILRCLMKPKVWRFVGFGSSVVGLLCYALSSSFKHLFGEWTFLKIELYSIFCLIISLMILYAKIWRHSRSICFKVHMGFSVLTITSIYSSFSDRVMNRKPDVYSLISSAAFSITSLSLSRQIQCGFEVDFLYFFLGCLIVQLMKIKLELVVVGVGFSYCLVILRSSFPSVENEDAGPQDEHQVVIEVYSLQLSCTNIAGMMQQLETCVKALQQENLNVMNMLSERAKECLEGKFEAELVNYDNYLLDALPSGRMNELYRIVKLMMDAGYEKECSQVYISWRREFLQVCLINKLFALGGTDMENKPKTKAFLSMMIGKWATASVVTFNILFPGEQQLCDCVFAEFSSFADQCFKEVCHGVMVLLLNFANAVVDGSPSAWRLFRILDMFKALDGLILKFQSLFPASFMKEAIAVKNKLGEASRDLFMELDKLIFRIPEVARSAAADGRLHPMTNRVMSYLSNAWSSLRTLAKIFHQYPKGTNGAGTSSFTAQMERIIKLLERKLVEKSKIYKDPALRCIFMMNNWKHIERMGEGWKMVIFGKDWFPRSRELVHQNLVLYLRSSWDKVLDLLKLNNNELMVSHVEAELMKENLDLFNFRLEQMSRVQSTWCVYNNKLREEIITSLENILLPPYGMFIGKFHNVLGDHAHEYIEYGMFDIQDRLNNLFNGGKMN